MFPERGSQSYSVAPALGTPGRKGPLRFEEGVGTDPDIPRDFLRGAFFDTSSAPGRINYNNAEAQYKRPEETMRERLHVGSASWIEAPSVLREFTQGAFAGYGEPSYERSMNPGTRIQRREPTIVTD